VCGRPSEEERAKVAVGTAALLEYLHAQQQQQDDATEQATEYTFCLGADAFLDLTAGKWKESARVLDLLQGRLLVLHRVDNESPGPEKGSSEELRDRVAAVPGATLLSLPSLGAVSSSRVREAVAAEEWESFLQDEGVIHPDVLAYIQQQGLYSTTTTATLTEEG
jgi:nicotinic acid mononucleotide adenylyltransferase